MTIVFDDGADDVGVGVGVAVGVPVGVAVGVADGVSVGEALGSGDVVSAGAAEVDAPAGASEVVRRPPDTAVAAVSAVTRAIRRQSPVLTRPILTRDLGLVGEFAEIPSAIVS